jgi:predicted acyltransferase
MIVVTNPGSWDHVYWPLLHAPWHGWTGADLIFPLFLFIVGVSMSFALF